ncbi:MAG: PhnD/SsuA/transferrin family substrate-binding protein [Anaerovoracaceae bacterium]
MGGTLNFLGKISGTSITHNYYVVARASSEYEKLKDIEGKTVGIMENSDDTYAEAQEDLKDKVDVSFESMGGFDQLAKALINENTDVIFMNSAYYDMAVEEIDGFTKDSTKILETIDITVEAETSAKSVNVTKDPFNVYKRP